MLTCETAAVQGSAGPVPGAHAWGVRPRWKRGVPEETAPEGAGEQCLGRGARRPPHPAPLPALVAVRGLGPSLAGVSWC